MPKHINQASGYAVVEGTEILVRTISPTRRAAMTNFLIVSRGILILNKTTDREIEHLWTLHRGRARTKAVRIMAEAS